ncbi:AraC family transcriptional regulator [Sphingobium sp. LB126]|uniref:helix-turn-helix domain-containing protein n=1 Tax=Sphingobium sp. LB126 TaxID=1983755 RepID=UPI0012FDCE58|nr:AraC family transcriptional regulator [Sphingobium sp. LB126]
MLIDGLPRLHQTDLRDTLTFAPRGCTIHGWSKPTARKNSFTALYFDPLQLRDDLGDRYATHDLGPFAYARDPALAATMRKLRDVAITSIVDGLYAEILCLSAALEIFGVSVQGEGKLSRRQLQAVYDFVEANLAERISLDDLAKLAGLSRSHFSRTFTATTGVGPHQFVRQRQLARARSLLAEQRDLPIDTIAKAVGFGSANVFRRAFQQAYGASPQVYRRDKL